MTVKVALISASFQIHRLLPKRNLSKVVPSLSVVARPFASCSVTRNRQIPTVPQRAIYPGQKVTFGMAVLHLEIDFPLIVFCVYRERGLDDDQSTSPASSFRLETPKDSEHGDT